MASGDNCEEDKYSMVRGASAIVAFLGCTLTLLLILFFQRYKTTLQRLFLYLTLGLTGETIVNVMQISNSCEEYCKAVGFLNQYSLHVVLLLMIGATVYLSHRVRKSSPGRRKYTNPIAKKNKMRIYCEAAFLAFSLIFPLTYNWIPFVPGSCYGGQPLCWFKVYTEKDCLIVFLILGCLPCIVVLSVCSILVLSIIAIYFRWACRYQEARKVLVKKAGGVMLFAAVLIVYLLYYCALLVTVIVFNGQCDDIPDGLLWFDSVILPIIRLMLPISFVAYLYRFRGGFNRARRSWVDSLKYAITKETDNSNPHWVGHELVTTYRKSEPENIPSTTCYPNLVEFTDEFLTIYPLPSDDMCLNLKPVPLPVVKYTRKRSATM